MTKKFFLISLMLLTTSACGSEHTGGLEPPGENIETGERLTFTEHILPLVKNRCSLCHNESSGLPNWENYEVLSANLDLVRFRVFENQDMPRGNATGMTQEERELLAQWIDEGGVFE